MIKINKKKICIIVDHPLRELDYLLLISYKLLEKSDYEIFLVEQYKKELIFLIKPDLVILPHVRENMMPIIIESKKKNILIAIVETEGGFTGKFVSGRDQYYKKALKYSDFYFIWGRDIFNYIKRLSKKKNYFLTGTPKFDFFRKELKKYYKSNYKYITFVSNFPIVNPKFNTLAENKNEVKQSEFATNKKKIDSLFETQHSVYIKFLDLVKKTTKKYKKEKFILKIHPFENEIPYKNIIKSKNVKFVQKENIAETLSKTKNLIHYNCQTAFEFFLSGRNAITYEFALNKNERNAGNFDLSKISLKPKNIYQFYNLIKKKHKFKNNPKLANKYGYRDNKNLSSDLIVDKIHSKIKMHTKLDKINKNIYYNYSIYLLIKDCLINFLPRKIVKILKYFLKRKEFNDKKLDFNLIVKNFKKINKIFRKKERINLTYPNLIPFLLNKGVIKISRK